MRTILLLAAFALPILIALSTKYRSTGGPAVTLFRFLVGLIGFVLVVAGLGGLGVCVWLILHATTATAPACFCSLPLWVLRRCSRCFWERC